MAAIGMVQMLIEAAEYLDRRERGKVSLYYFLLSFLIHSVQYNINTPPPPNHSDLSTSRLMLSQILLLPIIILITSNNQVMK